jgi:hypothetical protein
MAGLQHIPIKLKSRLNFSSFSRLSYLYNQPYYIKRL